MNYYPGVQVNEAKGEGITLNKELGSLKLQTH